jgi:hypothetical protein
MSRVIIKDINPGQALDVSDVNDTVDSWTAATTPSGKTDDGTGIASENIRDEGLDRRMFTKGDVTPSSGRGNIGWDNNMTINTGSVYDSQWSLLKAHNKEQIIGPFTYSPPPYDDHMLLVRYHMDLFAGPSEALTPSAGPASGNWQMKTMVSTRLAYIISSSTPTASSNWISMPSTTRRVRMGPFGFHAPMHSSIGFDINGGINVDNNNANLYWGSKDDDYTALSNIFAGTARLRQNICVSHFFQGGVSPGTTGYTYSTDYTDELYFGLQVKIDYWDDHSGRGSVTLGNSNLIARTFVR